MPWPRIPSGAHDLQVDRAVVVPAYQGYRNCGQAAAGNIEAIAAQIEIEACLVRNNHQAIGFCRPVPGEQMLDHDREIAVRRRCEIDRLANLGIAGCELSSLRVLDDHVDFRRRVPLERLNLDIETLSFLGGESEAVDVVGLQEASGNRAGHGYAVGVCQVIVGFVLDELFKIAHTQKHRPTRQANCAARGQWQSTYESCRGVQPTQTAVRATRRDQQRKWFLGFHDGRSRDKGWWRRENRRCAGDTRNRLRRAKGYRESRAGNRLRL